MSYRRGFDDYYSYNQPRSRPYSAVDSDHHLRKSYSDFNFRNGPTSPPDRARFDTIDGNRSDSILKRSPSFDRKVRVSSIKEL